MEILRIQGGRRIQGSVTVSGAKNAALPILFASLLTPEKSVIKNVPNLADIHTSMKVLNALGMKGSYDPSSHCAELDAATLTSIEAPYELVRTMRASVLVLGPLLGRVGEAKVSLPGGCAIGARPVDFHLAALEQMGAVFEIEGGYIQGKAPKGLTGADIRLPFPSVGATENVLMAAALASGETHLSNAAREPEITDLIAALRSMGAQIEGEGSSELFVRGVSSLKGMQHTIVADRVEAATFLCAGLITGGTVETLGFTRELLGDAADAFIAAGATLESTPHSLRISASDELKPINLETRPFPGFPTDMQAQFMALLTQAKGASRISETIFENRFMHVPELARLGAKIRIQGHEAIVDGPCALKGAIVMATDLRASASLILAGLAARGETIVRRIYHLDRGYERIEQKLTRLGADIRREVEK